MTISQGLQNCCLIACWGQVRPLEMFFPFDPYLLRRSARFLDLPTSYNTWSGTRHQDTDASHLSSDDELEVLEGKFCYQGNDYKGA